jgi:hypothetical protein
MGESHSGIAGSLVAVRQVFGQSRV